MKGERILLADDDADYQKSLIMVIEVFGEGDGHNVVGKAQSVKQVEDLMKKGLKPSIAFVDNQFPNFGDGQRAAEIIKKYSPETFIISLSADEGLRWGQENWVKKMEPEKLVEAITNLQH